MIDVDRLITSFDRGLRAVFDIEVKRARHAMHRFSQRSARI